MKTEAFSNEWQKQTDWQAQLGGDSFEPLPLLEKQRLIAIRIAQEENRYGTVN